MKVAKLVFSFLFLAACSELQAQILIGNLTTLTATTAGNSNTSISTNIGKGMGFIMGSTSETLADVELLLNVSTMTGTPVVEIWAASGTDDDIPTGTVLDTLTLSSTNSTTDVAEYTSASAFTFTAGASYVITFRGGTTGSSATWYSNSSSAYLPISPGSLATETGYISNTGGLAPTSWSTQSSTFNGIEVDVSAVPEPSVVYLFLLGLVGMGLLYRWRIVTG